MKIKDIIAEIQKITPAELAQSWDNTGLLVGTDENNAKNVLMTIDVTSGVIDEAEKLGCKFIISYHPVIWDGLKKVTPKSEGALVYKLIRSNIAVYSIHTSLDVIAGGVNDGLAEMIEIKEPEPIGDFVSMPDKDNYKLIVFVPADSVNAVAESIFKAGAGAIGNYSNCSFKADGLGSFKPLKGAKPAIGAVGRVETVKEVRFETIVPADKIKDVIKAMRDSHPYNEPAFDVIRLTDVENSFGLGRMGLLKKPVEISELIKNIKRQTGCKAIGVVGRENRVVKKAAVCAGICGKILNQVIAAGCDLYLTGELKHHEALLAEEMGLTVICLSHSVSERFILKKLAAKIKTNLKNVNLHISKADKDPFKWKNV